MGTSLTGTKPKDTYDSLIKVGDNGPISGTAKYLSDGLGNDLPIAVSTSNVGIGTSSPQSPLHVVTGSTYGAQINTSVSTLATTRLSIGGFTTGAGGAGGSVAIGGEHNHSASAQSAMTFYTHDGSSLNEVGRFLAGGGLTFNGDTAAANALDDYEEGTWTPSVTGATFSGTITGNYTKIGRQVFIQMQFINATISGASGAAGISGLPFTSASGPHNAISITYADSLPSGDSGYVSSGGTAISFRSGTTTSITTWVNGTNNKSIMLTTMYFV